MKKIIAIAIAILATSSFLITDSRPSHGATLPVGSSGSSAYTFGGTTVQLSSEGSKNAVVWIAGGLGSLPIWKKIMGHDLISFQQAEALFGPYYSPIDDTYQALCKGKWSKLHPDIKDYSPENYPEGLYTNRGSALTILKGGYSMEAHYSTVYRHAYYNSDPTCTSGRVQYLSQRFEVLGNVLKGNGKAIIRDENIPAYPWFTYIDELLTDDKSSTDNSDSDSGNDSDSSTPNSTDTEATE